MILSLLPLTPSNFYFLMRYLTFVSLESSSREFSTQEESQSVVSSASGCVDVSSGAPTVQRPQWFQLREPEESGYQCQCCGDSNVRRNDCRRLNIEFSELTADVMTTSERMVYRNPYHGYSDTEYNNNNNGTHKSHQASYNGHYDVGHHGSHGRHVGGHYGGQETEWSHANGYNTTQVCIIT